MSSNPISESLSSCNQAIIDEILTALEFSIAIAYIKTGIFKNDFLVTNQIINDMINLNAVIPECALQKTNPDPTNIKKNLF